MADCNDTFPNGRKCFSTQGLSEHQVIDRIVRISLDCETKGGTYQGFVWSKTNKRACVLCKCPKKKPHKPRKPAKPRKPKRRPKKRR